MSRTILTLSVQDAAAQLPELVSKLLPGEEIALTSGNRAVAKIIPQSTGKPHRGAGACKGMLTIIKEDDDHLADFKDYMY